MQRLPRVIWHVIADLACVFVRLAGKALTECHSLQHLLFSGMPCCDVWLSDFCVMVPCAVLPCVFSFVLW